MRGQSIPSGFQESGLFMSPSCLALLLTSPLTLTRLKNICAVCGCVSVSVGVLFCSLSVVLLFLKQPFSGMFI